MQPRMTHVPPTRCFSHRPTLAPYCAAAMRLARIPPEPAPVMTQRQARLANPLQPPPLRVSAPITKRSKSKRPLAAFLILVPRFSEL